MGAQVRVAPAKEQNAGKLLTRASSSPQISTPTAASSYVARGISTVRVSPNTMVKGNSLRGSQGSDGELQSIKMATFVRTNLSLPGRVTPTYLPALPQGTSAPFVVVMSAELHFEFVDASSDSPT